MGFFTDGVQAVLAERLFDSDVGVARRWSDLEPLRFRACCDRDSASLPWMFEYTSIIGNGGKSCNGLIIIPKMNLLRMYRLLYDAYGPQQWWPADSPFEVVVGAILTQSTSWKNVERAIANLKRYQALSPQALHTISVQKLAALIRPAGYFRQKARKLKAFVEHLWIHHHGNLKKMLAQPTEELRAELLSIWGIGPETADSILLYAAHKPIFVVDAYTKRIFSRLGLVSSDISYGELQKLFMRRLPKSAQLFNEYHALIVRHGKEVCRPKPLCARCPLARVCWFYRRSSSALGR